jgi:hypothetical protein
LPRGDVVSWVGGHISGSLGASKAEPCSGWHSRGPGEQLFLPPSNETGANAHLKEDFDMGNFTSTFSFAAVFAVAASALAFGGSAANAAGGAKDFFVQDYQFAKPMHGYSGHSGNYYCDYQRLPNRVCVPTADGRETCRIVGWTLREMCQ